MTDEQMRVAIAEYCGWQKKREIADGEWVWLHPAFKTIRGQGCIPDYPNDLNAMHAAEAGLFGHEMIRYQAELNKITDKNPHVSCWDLIHATARQRAEAFLRTVGKWKEDA